MEPLIIIKLLATSACMAGVAQFIGTTSGAYALNRKLKLNEGKPFTIDHIPPLATTKTKLNYMSLDEEATRVVDEFIDVFSKKEHVDLSNFYNNFRSYAIDIEEGEAIDGRYTSFSYALDTSRIAVTKKNLRKGLLNGLLLQAGTIKNGNIEACGFSRIKKSSNGEGATGDAIGRCFNDFYTDSLLERNFGIVAPVHFGTTAINIIENIVGAEKMEDMYFRGALDELVEELSKLVPEEDIIRLLRELDHWYICAVDKLLALNYMGKKAYIDAIKSLAKIEVAHLKTRSDVENIEDIEEIFGGMMRTLSLLSYNIQHGLISYNCPKKVAEPIAEEIADTAKEKIMKMNPSDIIISNFLGI